MLCALLALAPLSCASLEGGGVNDIKSVDLPVLGNPIAWIDNETLLLYVNTRELVTRFNGTRSRVFHLISYNYKSGERKDYGRAGSQICYADGYISYEMEADDEDEHGIAIYGELGKESRKKVRRGELTFDRGARGSCRPWSERPARPSWADTKTTIWYLWPRSGVIDCQTRAVNPFTKHIKARFHQPDDAMGVELPFSCEEVSGHEGLRYYRYRGAYFALEYDYRHPWPEGRDRRAFWLYPDGHVETLTFRYSQAIRERAIPVTDGILVFAGPADRKDDYWVYFLTPNSSMRLFRGYATGVTSPDGCKVAMVLDPDFKKKIWSRDVKTPVSLKILNFCTAK